MSEGAWFMLIVVAAFPTLILVALAVKLWEIRQASTWPETTGKVVTSKVVAKNVPRLGSQSEEDPNDGDVQIRNEPLIEYEYQVNGQRHRCNRYSIAERTSGDELEEVLERYPVGAIVTVYYNPRQPGQALLERDLPMGQLMAGLGCLLVFFIGGPLLGAAFYFNVLDWVKPHLARPDRAPLVAIVTLFGALTTLFAAAFHRHVWSVSCWPVTAGVILESGVAKVLMRSGRRRRAGYRSAVVYAYTVNGREYQGDQVTLGVSFTSNIGLLADRAAAKYPAGMPVEVHYNPASPGESVLHPRSWSHYVLWLFPPIFFGAAWALATGRI